MMKLLITGATGMVGKNLLIALVKTNHYQLLAPSRHELNLLDQTAVIDYLQKHKPDLIIHLAAKVGGIQANVQEPVGFLTENLLINIHVIQAALEVGIPRLINLGSSCMYPKDRDVLCETDLLSGQLEPTNEGYALAKITAARLCEYINKQYHLSYKTLIPCNLYGPYDNFDPVKSHLIPAIIRKIHEAKYQNLSEVSIWGDGQARREFMYVDDLVHFILKAIPIINELPNYLNIGLGQDYTVSEYYQTTANLIGFTGQFTYDMNKPVGMRRKLMDITQAKKFDWMAQTSLTNGIKKTYDYFLEHY